MIIPKNLPKVLIGHWKETYRFPAIVVLFSIIITIRFFSFYSAPEHSLWKISENLYGIGLAGLVVFYPKNKHNDLYRGDFKSYPIIFIITTALSFLPLYLVQGQSFVSTLHYQFDVVYWLLFAFMIRAQIHPRTLIRFCLWAGFGWSTVNIIQQLTFPRYLFSSIPDLNAATLTLNSRGGIYRFLIDGVFYALLAQYYAFNRYILTNKIKYLIYVGYLLVGIYCCATRQVLAASIGSMVIIFSAYVLNKRGRLPVKYLFAAVFAILIAYQFSDTLFGKLVQMTKEDATEDNIRVKSFNFFLYDYWIHPTAYLFGNGIPVYDSPLGREMNDLMKSQGLYQTDVGMVGTLSIHGIIFTASALFSVFLGAFRNQGVQKLFVNMAFLGVLFSLPLTPYFISGTQAPYFCILYLIADRKSLIDWDLPASESTTTKRS